MAACIIFGAQTIAWLNKHQPQGTLMQPSRRQLLSLAAGVASFPVFPGPAKAQAYPTRPVRLIVGAAAGAPPDLFARLIGQWLSDRLSQPFVIDNRPGVAGNIAIEAVARSAPDGYTLLLIPTSAAINATLYEKLNYNFIRDIAPIAPLVHLPAVMEVNPSFPAKTVHEFIAYAKANPSKINMASAGSGTAGHVAGELFKMMTGVDMVHIPYRSTPPALTDLIGGQVHVMFDTIPVSIGHIRAGRLRALAVTTAARLDALPDTPTMDSFVPGYEASGFFGVGAPRNTPAEIVTRLNERITAGILDPKIKARIDDLGGTVAVASPREFGNFIAKETEKWAKVVQFSGARPD
jgi:tripartite-type tricarboxylate transporter receptor subunit TctC